MAAYSWATRRASPAAVTPELIEETAEEMASDSARTTTAPGDWEIGVERMGVSGGGGGEGGGGGGEGGEEGLGSR